MCLYKCGHVPGKVVSFCGGTCQERIVSFSGGTCQRKGSVSFYVYLGFQS